MNQETLYRFFDSSGRLLYIGISNRWTDRLVQHRREKPWFDQVAQVTVHKYPSRQAVEQAEREAIASERPLYNVQHNGGTLAEKLKTSGRADRILQPGHFVALALYGWQCPVGQVVAIDDFIWIRPKSFVTGIYDMPVRGYRNEEVRQIAFAELGPDGLVDDRHLSDFQDRWTALRRADRARIGHGSRPSIDPGIHGDPWGDPS